jgi:hypothetical protein
MILNFTQSIKKEVSPKIWLRLKDHIGTHEKGWN